MHLKIDSSWCLGTFVYTLTLSKSQASMPFLSLYGLTPDNCCNKDDASEKVANALLPMSYSIYAEKHNIKIPLLGHHSSDTRCLILKDCFSGTSIRFDTELAYCIPSKFIHPPPNDIRVTRNTCVAAGGVPYSENISWYESKVVLFKERKTELILRQDCYAFNCLQQIVTHNPNKKYQDVDALLNDTAIDETPYLFMLLWKKETDSMGQGTHQIRFDCIVFTDVMILRMIQDAKTARASQALLLINAMLKEYASKGTMTYKANKSGTVPHQKVSLFPLRDIPAFTHHRFAFPIQGTHLILKTVRPDTSLWQEVEKAHLVEEIQRLRQLQLQARVLDPESNTFP